MTEMLLRAMAVLIALAALLDPSLTLSARPRPRIAVTVQRSDDLRSTMVRDRLASDLRGDFDVVAGPDLDAASAIIIGDRYPNRPPDKFQRTSTVTIEAASGVRIAGVRAPKAVPRGTRIRVDVDLDAGRAAGATSVVTVSAGSIGHADVEVARASHAWTTGVGRVSLRLDAMPLDLPPWHLRVRLVDVDGVSILSSSDLLVEEAGPLRVLFYEPRPSWIATFVRRALERDSRFAVSGLGYASRGIRIASGDVEALTAPSLRQFAAVVVGGVDRLSVPDRDLLDRFVRERGGSLALLPDARINAGPARDWLPNPDPREVLLERAASLSVAPTLNRISASELLTFESAAVPGAIVLARVSGSDAAVITVTPRGAGRVLVSGALDAWRFRADNDAAFDRFWESAVAGLALATPPAVDVEAAPSIAVPGETVRVVARISRAAFGASPDVPLRMSARLDGGEPLRLWPDAEVDQFSGSLVAGPAGFHRVVVSADAAQAGSVSGSALLGVDPAARHAEPIPPPLAMLAASRGGINVTPEHVSDLEAHLRREVSASPIPTTTHPMRSSLWILPFAACVSGEWWLRRRRGLR